MALIKTSITSESLAKKAGSVLNIFSKTVNDLTDVINQAKEQVKVKEEEIIAAQAEKESLEKVASDNQAIVDKLKSMLS